MVFQSRQLFFDAKVEVPKHGNARIHSYVVTSKRIRTQLFISIIATRRMLATKTKYQSAKKEGIVKRVGSTIC